MNGGRTEYNNWELDGGDNMDNGSNGTLNTYPNVDAIAEVKVLTSNYGAQYGRNGSATVETITKLGGRDFHGDLFEFLRNEDFNARNFFASSTPIYRKNDYGFTIGGPVVIPRLYNQGRQKTFFFFSEDWRKELVPGTVFNVAVPSAAERSGNFAQDCPAGPAAVDTTNFPNCPVNPQTNAYYPNNTVPVSSQAQILMHLIPAANTSSGFFNAAPAQSTNWREELVRIDHNINDKQRFFFRYIHDSWSTADRDSPLGNRQLSYRGYEFCGTRRKLGGESDFHDFALNGERIHVQLYDGPHFSERGGQRGKAEQFRYAGHLQQWLSRTTAQCRDSGNGRV